MQRLPLASVLGLFGVLAVGCGVFGGWLIKGVSGSLLERLGTIVLGITATRGLVRRPHEGRVAVTGIGKGYNRAARCFAHEPRR